VILLLLVVALALVGPPLLGFVLALVVPARWCMALGLAAFAGFMVWNWRSSDDGLDFGGFVAVYLVVEIAMWFFAVMGGDEFRSRRAAIGAA
jgi:hypothetical protein